MEPAIKVENISKTFRIYHENRNSIYETFVGFFTKKKYYEKLRVLDDITFSVNKGEIFGIMGKNGAGKSTLLRIISGIYKADKGDITINGKISSLLSLGAGFEIELTAKDNVLRYAMLLGMEKIEIEKKLKDIIEFAELSKFEDIKLKNFSSGMYQRLAFATMAHMNPDIMMIDEAIFAGDIGFQQKCFDTIIKFKQENKSIILVSHNMEPMESMCDRAMLLNNNKIESIGNPKDVIKQFKRLFTDQKSDLEK
tara:strand:- start:714 stop:1472 length:759 start_codon:yes stop_codon:yes gene_type:complete